MSHVGGNLVTLTTNTFTLNFTRFILVNVVAGITTNINIAIPRTNNFVSTCTVNIYFNALVLIFNRDVTPGHLLVTFVLLYFINGTVTTLTPDTNVLAITHFVSNVPRNTFFNATAVTTHTVTSGNRRNHTITIVILKRALTGALNIPFKALLTNVID